VHSYRVRRGEIEHLVEQSAAANCLPLPAAGERQRSGTSSDGRTPWPAGRLPARARCAVPRCGLYAVPQLALDASRRHHPAATVAFSRPIQWDCGAVFLAADRRHWQILLLSFSECSELSWTCNRYIALPKGLLTRRATLNAGEVPSKRVEWDAAHTAALLHRPCAAQHQFYQERYTEQERQLPDSCSQP